MPATVEELELRIAGLEKKLADDFSFLVKSFEDDQDALIRRIDLGRRESSESSNQIHDHVNNVDFELRSAVGIALDKTIKDLISRSDSAVVIDALKEALKSTILKTRPASREELKSGDGVLVVRQASVAELRGH
jgi:ethanolamine ammonia-lyase small subunit